MLEGVILAGGKGERFWPLSRPDRPKQLLRLLGPESLLETTWRRLRLRLACDRIRVVTGANLVAEIRRQLPELPGAGIVSEPVGRDTAPALAVAAALGAREGRDLVQIVAPSDHWIGDPERFWACIERAVQVARAPDSPLVTLGIPIRRPETGYGYIERGDRRSETEGVWQVRRFHEKPDEPTARAYQADGGFFWNSGIFVWRAAGLLEEVARRMPDLHALVAPLVTAADPEPLLDEVFERAPSRSIDFGVLEGCDRVAVVAAEFEWDDLGSWSSWGDLAAREDGNAVRGDVLELDTSGCVLIAEEGMLATVGLRDLVVVRTGDVTLVLPKSRSQEVRRILQALRERAAGGLP